MIVGYKILNTSPGGYAVGNNILKHVTILRVCREGIGVNRGQTPLVPTGREYYHFVGLGVIQFDPAIPFNPGEKIYVRYKQTS